MQWSFEFLQISFNDDSPQIVEESSAVLHLSHEVQIGQNSDHRDIARFLSAEDRNSRPVKMTLENFRKDIAQRGRKSAKGSATSQTPEGKGAFAKSKCVQLMTF